MSKSLLILSSLKILWKLLPCSKKYYPISIMLGIQIYCITRFSLISINIPRVTICIQFILLLYNWFVFAFLRNFAFIHRCPFIHGVPDTVCKSPFRDFDEQYRRQSGMFLFSNALIVGLIYNFCLLKVWFVFVHHTSDSHSVYLYYTCYV